MKKTMTLFLALFASASVFAQGDHSVPRSILRLPPLCQLSTEEGPRLFESHSFDALQMSSLDKKILAMIQIHLKTNTYTTSDELLSLAQIKDLFANEYEYDELKVTFLKHRASQRQYVYVNSYPGDNEYGVYFDAVSGEVVGTNGDGSIDLETNQGHVSCDALIP